MLNQDKPFSVPVDLIRSVAIVGVLLLHAANDLTIQHLDLFEIFRWSTVDVYQTLGRIGVPLFVMLSGALLLQPSKNESIRVFFKKRWARIGLPFLFWSVLYFVWSFYVDYQVVTSNAIIQGILKGPYFQFWYLYMLAGLYLLTPILRIVVARADSNTLKYFVIVWFLGASIVPLIALLTSYNLDSSVFVITGFVGYYVLGIYLLDVKVSRRALWVLVALGVALTGFGTYALAYTIGGGTMFFFQEYLSPTMILASVMVFLLLNTIKPVSINKETSHIKVNKILKVISENTLPIFFLHVIVLETLQRGYLGFAINGNTINSVIGVPLAAVVTLAICLAVILPLKKVPGLKKLIG